MTKKVPLKMTPNTWSHPRGCMQLCILPKQGGIGRSKCGSELGKNQHNLVIITIYLRAPKSSGLHTPIFCSLGSSQIQWNVVQKKRSKKIGSIHSNFQRHFWNAAVEVAFHFPHRHRKQWIRHFLEHVQAHNENLLLFSLAWNSRLQVPENTRKLFLFI